MLRGVIYRLLQAIPVVVIFAVLVFLLLQLLPGDPAVAIAGNEATPEAIDRIRTQLGLDRPLLEQLLSWFNRLAHGDFGKSLLSPGTTVAEVIRIYLPWTLFSVGIATILSFIIGIMAGMLMAYRRETWIDHVLTSIGSLLHAIPNYLLAIMIVEPIIPQRNISRVRPCEMKSHPVELANGWTMPAKPSTAKMRLASLHLFPKAMLTIQSEVMIMNIIAGIVIIVIFSSMRRYARR